MVVTTLVKEASPLIRYRTRDLTRLIDHPCSCGSILPLHDRILGRSDDMIILRGVNLYPAHIDEVLSRTRGIGSEYQIHLNRLEDGKDHMAIRVERAEKGNPGDDSALSQVIAGEIRKKLLVSGEVEIVAYGALPRSERKSKRVFDNRGF
jgi:phenylacetate-CoA ligase